MLEEICDRIKTVQISDSSPSLSYHRKKLLIRRRRAYQREFDKFPHLSGANTPILQKIINLSDKIQLMNMNFKRSIYKELSERKRLYNHFPDSSKEQFKFDHVFGPEDNQEAVFVQTKPIVASVLDGYNVCIFAYGQTGTGKTFTMEGSPENRGVNYRTLD
ncbi:hypothetical protein H0E87_009738, partial [Populus deltoides]